MNDFNRELSSYVDELNFDGETFYETERRLDLINNLKAKYGQSIEAIHTYCGNQKQKLEDLDRYEENFRRAKAEVEKSRAQLEICLLYTSPSPRDRTRSRMPSSA